jgi:hypothetical protein
VQIDPRPLVRADLVGLVSLVIAQWTGVVLILVAGTGVAYTLRPWEDWLPRKGQLPRRNHEAGVPLAGGTRSKGTHFP